MRKNVLKILTAGLLVALLMIVAAVSFSCAENDTGDQNEINTVYTVTFVADGVTVDTVEYERGDVFINEPPVPEKDGYSGEWQSYRLSGGNITVNAVYTAIEYKVTFVADGETVAERTYTVDDANINEPPVPEKDGYTGEWERYRLSGDDITVEAIYTAIEYKVTFVADGKIVAERTYTVDDASVDEPPVPEKDGFSGEWEEYELTGGDVTVNDVYSADVVYGLTTDSSFYVLLSYTGSDSEFSVTSIYNGLRVVGIADNAFSGLTTIQRVYIPNTVSSIGASAFSGCTGLVEIDIPESVKTIGNNAFSGCIRLKNLNEMTGVETVGTGAFSDCLSLETVVFGDKLTSIGDGAFSNCSALKEVGLKEGLRNIGAEAFDNCVSLTDIELPSSLSYLGVAAFRHAESLKSINIPARLDEISNAAFQYCISLESIEIPENIGMIGESSFSYCISLQTVDIWGGIDFGDSARDIAFGNSAFYNCTGITTINYNSESNEVYGDENYIFYNAGTSADGIELVISNGASVPEGLFTPFKESNAPKITEIIWEDGIVRIEDFNEYNYLPYLQKVVLPDGVNYISEGLLETLMDIADYEEKIYYVDNYAVMCDDDITEADIRDGTRGILTDVFVDKTALTSLTVPDSVEYISRGVLSGCTSLQTLSLPYLGSSSSDSSNAYLGYLFGATSYGGNSSYVPSSLTSVTVRAGYVGDYAFSGLTYLSEVVLPQNMTYVSAHLFDGCTSLSQAVIPSGVSSIGDYAFNGCSSLGDITIPQSVTDIGQYAFRDCYAEIVWEGTPQINHIGSYAFAGYLGSSLSIPSSVTSISRNAVNGCNNLNTLTIPFVGSGSGSYSHFGYIFGASSYSSNSSYVPSSLTTVVITGGSEIAANAFYNCRYITSIVIPSTVYSIGSNAFYGCNSLGYVFYAGEESAWSGISGYNNVTATVYYYSESEIYGGNYWHYDEYGMPVIW